MARGGAVSSRGRGKFKVARGGGRHFSRDLDPRFNQEDEASESSSEEEEESEDEPEPVVKLAPEMAALNLKLGNTVSADEQNGEEEMSRAERKAMKKAQAAQKPIVEESESNSDDEEEKKPAPVSKAAAKGKPKKVEPVQLSRKEREAADKKAAAQRHQQLHAQGKTSEAKSDLARLQEVRARRDAAAAQRNAEVEEKAREAAAKKEKIDRK
ncbi:hypothetical protein B9479_005038 [Cryptococcus floricola]|uniref:Casein kinase substrate phosphoprotein PP28 domain-containing protein n=1 Tax=Cryptococcus floricola TaxID=2591691 RepID=A0A5D3AVL1_9TREE|nr:hypothetical protein B9479_005038 [Cryptococcus floricola]